MEFYYNSNLNEAIAAVDLIAVSFKFQFNSKAGFEFNFNLMKLTAINETKRQIGFSLVNYFMAGLRQIFSFLAIAFPLILHSPMKFAPTNSIQAMRAASFIAVISHSSNSFTVCLPLHQIYSFHS